MQAGEIISDCLKNLRGTVFAESWGEKGVFYNPERKLKRGIYTLTVKEKNGDHDKASKLDRPGIYRINLGIRKKTFEELFSAVPKRPAAGETVAMPFDFSVTNTILPHPVYAWMGWICILSPDKNGFERLKPYIKESYALALEKYQAKKL